MFPLLPLLYLTSWSVTPYGYFAHWEWPHLVPLFLYWFRFPSKDKRFSLFMVVMPIELPQIINHRTYENTSLGFHKPWTLPTIDQHLILFHVYFCLKTPYSSLVAQWVKTLPTMQETWIWFLGWEDLLEKEMASHSSILAWEIPWTEEPGGLWSIGYKYSYILRWCSFRTLTHKYWGRAVHPKADAITSIIRKCNFWIPIFAFYPLVMRLLTKQLLCALELLFLMTLIPGLFLKK